MMTMTATRCALGLIAGLTSAHFAATAPIDFARDVRPILTVNCAGCHGAAKQRAGLRLDSGAGVLRGSASGRVVLPGRSEASKLVHAITGKGDAPAMPPKGPR